MPRPSPGPRAQRSRPAPPTTSSSGARAVLTRLASGEVTVDEALAALDRDVDRILEKRRWLLARGIPP